MKTVKQEYTVRDVGEREVGIEIEMEGRNLQPQFPQGCKWTIVGEGSLRGEAVEYVLKSPEMRKNVKTRLTELQELLHDSTLRPTERASVHIHISNGVLLLNSFHATFSKSS